MEKPPGNCFQFRRVWRELLTLFRFGIVGVMATAVHIFVVWVLLNHTHLATLIANALAFLTAFGVSFSGHYFWTFQNPGAPGRAIRHREKLHALIASKTIAATSRICTASWIATALRASQ
jgi:putative flippase GtrA